MEGWGCKVQGARCRVQGAGCKVQGARCKADLGEDPLEWQVVWVAILALLVEDLGDTLEEIGLARVVVRKEHRVEGGLAEEGGARRGEKRWEKVGEGGGECGSR